MNDNWDNLLKMVLLFVFLYFGIHAIVAVLHFTL
jgi:hypothetical protein